VFSIEQVKTVLYLRKNKVSFSSAFYLCFSCHIFPIVIYPDCLILLVRINESITYQLNLYYRQNTWM